MNLSTSAITEVLQIAKVAYLSIVRLEGNAWQVELASLRIDQPSIETRLAQEGFVVSEWLLGGHFMIVVKA